MSKAACLAREKRHMRIRKRIIGTKDVPRMSIYRSLRHMYIQLIDDINARTLLSCSTLSKKVHDTMKEQKNNKKTAELLGKLIAEMTLEKGIKKVIFDRSGYKYHGKIQVLADAVRKAGLAC